MNIYAEVAKNMEPDKLKILANYRAEAKFFRWLPTGDELNILPSGFLIRAIHDGKAVAQLNQYGMRVAMAAEKIAKEEAA